MIKTHKQLYPRIQKQKFDEIESKLKSGSIKVSSAFGASTDEIEAVKEKAKGQ